jgi:hypothetical protein
VCERAHNVRRSPYANQGLLVLKMSELEKYAQDKVKVRVTFESGKTKWGWVHQYNGKWWLTRGNRVGFSLDTAVKIEEMSK